MKLCLLDFESYYCTKSGYSLRKVAPIEYILDPRFEAIGCAVKEDFDGEPYWVDGPELQKFFNQLPTNIAVAAFNTPFDGAIANWRYGYSPKLWMCGLAIARACLGHKLRSLSLDSVSSHLEIGKKGGTVHKVDGMRRSDIIAAGIYDEYVAYSMNDVELLAAVIWKLAASNSAPFPSSELATLDMILRCTIEPQFYTDTNVLEQHLTEVIDTKEQLLAKAICFAGLTGKDELMSNPKFAAALEGAGAPVPMKISKTTKRWTYAFSKTDPQFMDLAEHPDQTVQLLHAARLGNKSTLEETRTERLIGIGKLAWPDGQVGRMPIPLKYSGAIKTHRLSGDWKINWQNASRHNPIKPGSGKVRKSLVAPPGHKVVTVDASQIEARMVVYFSGQWDVVEDFAAKRDVYALLAQEIYGKPINKKDNPNERFVGKQGRLGLGYQLWWNGFKSRVKTDSINQLGYPIELSDEFAEHVVKTFRRKNFKVKTEGWDVLNNIGIPVLANGGRWEWGSCVFEQGKITGPTGLVMGVAGLHHGYNKFGKQGWFFYHAGVEQDLYGGKVMENICQHLARVHTLDAAIRIQRRSTKELRSNYRLASQVHDENVFIVKDEHVEIFKEICLEEMRRRPWWAPGLPLDAESGWGQNYGEAK